MSEEIVYVYYLFHDTQEFVHVENAIEESYGSYS